MFGPLAVVFLVTVAVGGVAYVFLYPMLSGEKRVEQRLRDIAADGGGEMRRARRVVDPTQRRRQAVEDTLKQLEERRKNSKRPPLGVRIQQAGVTWSKRQFWIGSAAAGVFVLVAALLMGAPRWSAPVLALTGALAARLYEKATRNQISQ